MLLNLAEKLGLPLLASRDGGQVDAYLGLFAGFIAVFFTLYFLIYVFLLVKYRRSGPSAPGWKNLSGRWPLLGAGLIFVLEAGILLQSARSESAKILQPDLQLRVVAQQYEWHVHYPGEDGVFGRTGVAFVDQQTNPVGLDREDPAAKDDVVERNRMTLPVGRVVEVLLSSKDVVHSFGVPEFRVKQDAVPGMTARFQFMPTMTTDALRDATGSDSRDFEIACAQLCGQGHYRMRGIVIVLEQDAFDAWKAEKSQAATETKTDDFWE